jgi:hypothetical protein
MKIVTSNHREAVAALVAEYGPDAEVTATLRLKLGNSPVSTSVEVAVDGEPLAGWRGALVGAFDAETGRLVAGTVVIQCIAPLATFAIGELSRPRDGDQVHGTVAELIEHPAPMKLQG